MANEATNTRNISDFKAGASIGGGAPSTAQGGNVTGRNLNVQGSGGPVQSTPGNKQVFYDNEGVPNIPKVKTQP